MSSTGFHVGLPCMKLSINPSSQKYHGKAAKTCSVKDAWREMNDERRGRDNTIDHDMTDQNVWLEGNTDMDMERLLQEEINRVNADRKEHGHRALRSDAVSGIEMIEKPPVEFMETLSRDDQIKFLKASDKVLEGLIHDRYPEWRTVAAVIHFDEFGGRSPHTHRIVIPVSREEDGSLTMNAKRDFNLSFFTYMNQEYPRRMRELGINVLDCKIYECMDEEEKSRHSLERREYGIEGYEYKQKKMQEQDQQIAIKDNKIDHMEKMLQKKQEDLKAIESKRSELVSQNKELRISIMSKKKIEELPEPAKTIGGDYKVPVNIYQQLLATAKQADVVKDDYDRKHKALMEQYNKRKTELDQREEKIEKERKLPFKEKTELVELRKMKAAVEWVRDQLPEDNLIRKWLDRALNSQKMVERRKVDRRIEIGR